MELTLLPGAGFCPGVRRAATEIERVLDRNDGTRVCVLGELIHNRTYTEELAGRGVETVSLSDAEQIAAESDKGRRTELFVRAHGITAAAEELLSSLVQRHPLFFVRDMTCFFVRKIHEIVARHTGEDSILLLLGTPGHPEAEGILGHARGETHVFPDAAALDRLLPTLKTGGKRILLAAQTTQNVSEWKKSQKKIRKVYTNAKIFDTICNITEKRQAGTAELAARSDGMIVIGGKSSSNSRKLYETASAVCPATVWIETAEQLTPERFRGIARLGITAGASTPDSVIEEVVNKMANENTENFAEMLEGALKTLNTGDVVSCTVTSVSSGELGVDIGAKVSGVIPKDNVTDDPAAKLEELFKVGDTFDAFVVKVSDVEGMATLSKKRVDQMQNWNTIVEAEQNGTILEGKIVEAVRGGVIILVNGIRVFIPGRLTGLPKDADLSQLVGKTEKIRIIDINQTRRHAYGSIRSVLDEEKKAREAEVWANIEEGKHYIGRVKSLTGFGAFVDIGGVDGMVHNTELSWKRIKHPSEVVKVGDEIEVFVKSFDPEKRRISLGYKTPEMNNWYVFTAQHKVGDVIPVKIVSLMPFGAFGEILDGVDGLIHVTQIADHKVEKPEDELKLGDIVNVKITQIDEEKQKVSLSIRALLRDLKNEAAAEEESVEAPETDADNQN
ncbi:MAG: 4-hydroxy-3-methylbut-2-enyl diphosphate reductase [Eubacteriales bacterium]|nr:4-hydroxy-3-methylbut-2-enyl diphosphate reductase [Eubacteriales bacterium]